ncbi:MAG: N-acetylmuramoyl-L-alanine amidase [Thermoanaerobaculia bacterium]
MARQDRIKRRMIRQLVRDNLETLEGAHPRRRGRRLRTVLTVARVLLLVALPAALFTSTYVLSTVAAEWRDDVWQDDAHNPTFSTRAPISFSEMEPLPPIEPNRAIATPQPIDPSVLPLALHTVVLDPGHGGENEGTISPTGLIEKEITLDIGQRVRSLLESYSYKVVMTRQRDEDFSLKQRAELANQARGDIFVSIHVNWIENREVRGVETFFLGATEDPYLEALAARENQNSGYSLADFRDILEQVYAGVRQEESRQLAGAMQQALYDSLRAVNSTVRDRGVKSAPFGVLTHTEMPAILAEVSCVSNDVEARLLMTPIYRQYLAEAIVEGIQIYARSLGQANHLEG